MIRQEGDGVLTKRRRRILLLILITFELLGAAVILWRLFGSGGDGQVTRVSVTAEIPPDLDAALDHWLGRQSGELTWAGEPIYLPAIRFCLVPARLGDFGVRSVEAATMLRVYLP